MAPTLTPRLGLSKPAPTDLYDVGIDNGNMDILDRVGGLTFCTSTTRPAQPFPGMEIYETDTKLHFAFQPGTPGTWVRITPGFIGGRRYDASNTTLTTLANNTVEQLTGMETGPIVCPPNTSVRINAQWEYDDVTGGSMLFRIRDAGLAGVQWAVKQGRPQVINTTRQHDDLEALIIIGASGFSGTFVLTAQRGAANATVPRFYRSNTTRPFMYAELMGGSSALASV